MKTLLIILALAGSATTLPTHPDLFCEGWEDGYVQGYCYEEIVCYAPLAPPCPPRLTYYRDDHYQAGYNDGFIRGLEDR